jgi:hypothetical protein
MDHFELFHAREAVASISGLPEPSGSKAYARAGLENIAAFPRRVHASLRTGVQRIRGPYARGV